MKSVSPVLMLLLFIYWSCEGVPREGHTSDGAAAPGDEAVYDEDRVVYDEDDADETYDDGVEIDSVYPLDPTDVKLSQGDDIGRSLLSEGYEDFSKVVYSQTKAVESYIDHSVQNTDENQDHSIIAQKPGNCRILHDKRKLKFNFGKIGFAFKKGNFKIADGTAFSRASMDNLFSLIRLYDVALNNICLILERLDQPTTEEERQFYLDLLTKQTDIVNSYTKLRVSLGRVESDEDLNTTVVKFTDEITHVQDSE